jgi:subtilase family serine protease
LRGSIQFSKTTNFLKDWAGSNNLTISQVSVGRTTLTVRGSVAVLNRLFKTQINNYKTSDGVTYYSAGIAPTVPAEIGSKVVAVIGLTSGTPNAALAKVGKTLGEHPAANSALKPAGRTEALGTGPGGTYAPQDLHTAYSIPTWGSLVKGQTVAIFEQGYYNPADVSFYETYFKTGSSVKQVPISVDHSPILFEPAIEVEACLDVDMIIAMNPKVAKVLVYIDDYQYDPFDVAITDAFTRIADDAQATVVSASYGEDEGFFIADGTEVALDTALQQCAAQGITVLASSGDDGAFGNYYHFPYNVSNPASDPYITGVGGTSLLTTTGEQYELENAWNEFPYYGATGGGISTYWSQPAYQNIPYTGYTAGNGGSATMRNVPDVAADAAVTTGVAVYVSDQGGWLQIGGTSVASPLWAGYLSNINAALTWTGLGNLGFFNPSLYSVGVSDGATRLTSCMTSRMAITAIFHSAAPVTITVLAIATRPATVQYGPADSAYSFCSPGNRRAPLLGRWLPGLSHPQHRPAQRSNGPTPAVRWVMRSACTNPARCSTVRQASLKDRRRTALRSQT